MHLWPSMRLRDSFKIEYLKKLEWNLHRMNSEKKQQQQAQDTESSSNYSNQQKLLNDSKKGGKFLVVCRELFLILSCCYCCFCCGACVEDGDNWEWLIETKKKKIWSPVCNCTGNVLGFDDLIFISFSRFENQVSTICCWIFFWWYKPLFCCWITSLILLFSFIGILLLLSLLSTLTFKT